MSRLDRHVAMVQNKLALGRFIHALAWASLVYAVLFWVAVVVDRVFRVRPPHYVIWIYAGAGAGVLAALVYAVLRRPTRLEAAVAIDERLALKEKFSTALYARPLNDPFAQAAVKDAERTADNVSLHRRFPLEFPREGLGTFAVALLVVITMAFLPKMDLFGKEAQRVAKAEEQKKIDEAKQQVEKALQVVVAVEAKGQANEETIKQAKNDLQQMLNAPIRDPEKTKRSAARALSDIEQALKQQIAGNQKFADAENDAKAFKSLMPASDEKGPVADAQRKMAKGDFDNAVKDIEDAVEKFDKMTEEEKAKAAKQMAQMAQQLANMANDPKQQQQMQNQLQQMGLNQQDAQKAQQLMQQAAAGDKKAQQQLQQMANQLAKQMNNGQGPNPQQQQQIQNMMKQMQAQMNTQMQAQQMAQAAQQMAQAMKMQAQQGGQPGQQQAQQAANQMAQGKAQMQQQLNAMQAMKADAQQVAAAQAAAAQAAQDAANGLNGGQNNGGQPNGQGGWQGNNGQWNNNNNRQFKGPNNGMAGGGIGAGDRSAKEQAPYQVKQEVDQSPDDEKGKILASTLIKAKSQRGESKVGESSVAPPPEQEATDEVEQERISRPAQQAVKEYFSAWQKDSTGVPVSQDPSPAPQPAAPAK
jgi:hypothetical protein